MNKEIEEHINHWLYDAYYSWLEKAEADRRIETAKNEFVQHLNNFNINLKKPFEITHEGVEILKCLYAICKGRLISEKLPNRIMSFENSDIKRLKAQESIVNYGKKGEMPKRIIIDYGTDKIELARSRGMDIIYNMAVLISSINMEMSGAQKLLALSKKRNRKTYERSIREGMVREFYAFIMYYSTKPVKQNVYNFILEIFTEIGWITPNSKSPSSNKKIEQIVKVVNPNSYIMSIKNPSYTDTDADKEWRKEYKQNMEKIKSLENFILGKLAELNK